MARDGTKGKNVDDAGDVMRTYADQARQAVEKFAQDVELERRIQENPLAVLGVAAAAGFILGGGLWPVLRPFARAAVKTALSPANLLAIGAAIGAMRASEGATDAPDLGEEVQGSH
jgi:hypothetical protein